MSKSNWKGSSGWNSYDDPTGVLEGTPLFVNAGRNQIIEDCLIQEIGTSSAFNKDHYKVQIDFAFYFEQEVSGRLGLISRGTSFTTSVKKPFILENCYLLYIDVDTNTISLVRRRGNEETTLFETQLSVPMLYETKYTLTLSCYGSEQTNIKAFIGNEKVMTYLDNSALNLLSGFPGLYCSGGKFFVNNFAIMELNSDGTDA